MDLLPGNDTCQNEEVLCFCLCESGSYLVRAQERELLICRVSVPFSTQLEALQGKHQRISKSDFLIVRLPKIRCIFELFEVSLLTCNPNGLLPIPCLFSWLAFMSLPKSKLLTLIFFFFCVFCFSQQASPYLISSKQLTKPPLIVYPPPGNSLCTHQPAISLLKVCFTLCIPGNIYLARETAKLKVEVTWLNKCYLLALVGFLRTGGESLLCLFSELSCVSKGFVNLWGFKSVWAHARSQGWLSLNTGGNLIRKLTKLCFTGLRQLRVA